MKSLSPKAKQILYAGLAVVVILLLVVAGMLLASRMRGDKAPPQKVIVQATSMPAAITQPTATMVVTSIPERVAVKDGHTESDTGIAILPRIELTGDRRYVMQVTSKAGAISFRGSYTRGSTDPIAIDVMKEIKGTTPWEAEIEPPSAEARHWTLGVSLNTDPVGKNVQVQIWDAGPK